MFEAWRDLSDRERILISIAAVLAVLLVILQFIVSPIYNWRETQERKLRSSENLYELVAEASAVAGGVQSAETAPKANVPIRKAVTDSAKSSGVNITFVNARDDGTIETSTPSANPDRLYAWLEKLRSDYGVGVAYADIARDRNGLDAVRARIVLER
ncbi:MAG: type II secretion system protein GspM [Pseudomonadota bacterium]